MIMPERQVRDWREIRGIRFYLVRVVRLVLSAALFCWGKLIKTECLFMSMIGFSVRNLFQRRIGMPDFQLPNQTRQICRRAEFMIRLF